MMVFAHLGGDVGFSNSYLVGATVRIDRKRTNAPIRISTQFGAPVTDAFTGDTDMWGLDFVWKWAPDGNPVERNFKLQAEYFHRNENGALTFDLDGPQDATGHYNSDQNGWYAQAVYQFMPRWRVGARYDHLDSGSTDIGLVDSGALPSSGLSDPRRPRSAPHDDDGRLFAVGVLALAPAVRVGPGALHRYRRRIVCCSTS